MTRTRLIRQYAVQQAIHWMTIGLIVPVFTLFQLAKGLSLLEIGVTVACYSGTVILLELPTGSLADTIGRVTVYRLSLVMSAAALLVLMIAGSLITMIAGFVLLGSGRALSSGSMDAWFVDEYHRVTGGGEDGGDPDTDGTLQAALASVGIVVLVSLGASSIIGGILPDTLGPLFEPMHRFDQYAANLVVMLLIIAIQFLYVGLVIREHTLPVDAPPGPDDSAAATSALTLDQSPIVDPIDPGPPRGGVVGATAANLAIAIRYGLGNRTVRMLLVSTAAIGVALVGLENFWQPRLQSIVGANSPTWIFGLLSAGYFLSASIGNAIATPVCRLFGNRYRVVLFLSRLAMGGVWLALAMQQRIAGFAALYIGVFLFNGLATSPHATLLNEQIPAERRSTILSFESVLLQIGAVVGVLFMALISSTRGIPAAWIVGASALALSSICYLLIPAEADVRAESGRQLSRP